MNIMPIFCVFGDFFVMKTRVGIIGCGNIANGKHMPTLAKIPDVEMVAFCDLIEERAQEAAKKYGTPTAAVYTDYREMLKRDDIDNVRVLTQNRAHSEISVAALRAGKNVLCEKPMAINSVEGQKMLDAAHETGKVLSIGYQHRQDADVQYVKKEAMDGRFGEIYFAKARVLRRRGVPTHGVFLDEEEQGGGCLVDVGTHALDTVLWMMNNYEPKYVCGSVYHKLSNQKEAANPFGQWDPEKFKVEDSAFGYIVMKNGATILLETSWALNMLEGECVQYMLCGTEAGCDNFTGHLRINGVRHNTQYIEEPKFAGSGVAFMDSTQKSPILREQEVFLDACAGKGELTVLPEQAFVVTQILDAIYTSNRTGQPVFFD